MNTQPENNNPEAQPAPVLYQEQPAGHPVLARIGLILVVVAIRLLLLAAIRS